MWTSCRATWELTPVSAVTTKARPLPRGSRDQRDEALAERRLHLLQGAARGRVVGADQHEPVGGRNALVDPVEVQGAAVIGQGVEDRQRIPPRLDHLVEIADRALANGPRQRAIDPLDVSAVDQEAPDQVAAGQIVVTRDGEERSLQQAGHVLDQPGLPQPVGPVSMSGDVPRTRRGRRPSRFATPCRRCERGSCSRSAARCAGSRGFMPREASRAPGPSRGEGRAPRRSAVSDGARSTAQRIDAHPANADVKHRDARRFGLFDRAPDVRPRVLPFVAFVGGEAVSEGKEDPALRGTSSSRFVP